LRVSLLIPVIASILILGVLGLSQDAMAATLPVTDQFGDVHQVDEGMFKTSNDAGCMGGLDHHHADNDMGFVTSDAGVRINDTAPTMCGYGLVGGALTGEIEAIEFTAFIDTTLDCKKSPPESESETRIRGAAPNGDVLAESEAVICIGGTEPFDVSLELSYIAPFDLHPSKMDWTSSTDISNGDEEKSCDKKLRVDKDNEITSKIRCGLKKALGAVFIKIIGIILSIGPV